jgi:hypothetical protein
MAIGFEFATSITVGPANPNVVFPKAARLSRGTGWEMVVDGTDVEFVLTQVEESDLGRGTLELNIDMLLRFIAQLVLEFGKQNTAVRTLRKSALPKLFPHAPDFILSYSGGNQPIGCIPQVTAGIRLGRLRRLMRIMSDPNSAVAEQFLGGSGDQSKTFYSKRLGKAALDHKQIKDPNWVGHSASSKLRGLVSLIVLYLLQGDSTASVGAVKYLTFVMSRTKFSALFNELPTDERDHYRASSDDWVSFLCTSMLQAAANKTLDPKGQVIGQLVTDRLNLQGDKRATVPVRRKDWLAGMTKGKDLLSAAAHPIEGKGKTRKNVLIYKDSNPGLGHRLRGLAALGDKMDDITYGTKTERGAILEFRARQKEVLIGDWKEYALDAFDFFRELNEGDRDTDLDFGGDDNDV